MRSFLLLVVIVAASPVAGESQADKVIPIPKEIRTRSQLKPHYAKCVLVGGEKGLPIIGSKKVDDRALLEAAWIVRGMLKSRPDVIQFLAKSGVRVCIMAPDEFTTDIPEHSDLVPRFYWDRRARGLGPPECTSCGEENLLGLPGDPYSKENILVHEFAHTIHLGALRKMNRTFDRRLREIWKAALKKGLWKNAYAATSHTEYWAEGVQSWFGTNRENDREHNHVNTRAELIKYDPALAKMIGDAFGKNDWQYSRPEKRRHMPHLKGFKPVRKFAWPKELLATYDEFFEGGITRPFKKKPTEFFPVAAEKKSTWDSARSKSSRDRAHLVILNRTPNMVKVFWVDPKGRRRPYGSVNRGSWSTQKTFAGHVWLITDAKDRPLALFVARKGVGRAVVK